VALPDAQQVFDLDQLIPPNEMFKVRGQEIAIAPVFSVADNARYTRMEERLNYEAWYAYQGQLRRQAYNAVRIEAEKAGETPPEPPQPLDRDETFPPYTNEDFDRDALDLLTRIWQASEAAKRDDERVAVTGVLVRETFTRSQAWAVVQRLWPRRYGQRTAAPAVQPSATPVEPPKPAAKKQRRSARLSIAS
jgi:hypothetical protein